MPIHLKRLDGTVTRYRNAEYIPAYLFLSESVLNRCPQELHLPRTVFSFFHDRDVIRVVESNLFIELMMDAYAFLVWPYLGVRGYMESYSGYDPVYIIAHSPGFWVQELTDERILPTVEDLFRSGQAETMAYPSEAVVSDYLAQIIPAAMGKYNLDVVIETAMAMRCPEDFDFRQSGVKIDFFRQWYHTRTQRAEFSLEAYNKKRFNQYEANEIDILNFSNRYRISSMHKPLTARRFAATARYQILLFVAYAVVSTAIKFGIITPTPNGMTFGIVMPNMTVRINAHLQYYVKMR